MFITILACRRLLRSGHQWCRTASGLNWACLRQYTDYSFTKNIDDDDDGGGHGGPVAESLMGMWSSMDALEPRRLEEVILRIAKWLDCSYDDASHVLLSTPQLRSCHLETMDTYIDFLQSKGVDAELLRINTWLLTESMTTMRPKVRLVARMVGSKGFQLNMVPLLRLTRANLKRVMQKHESGHVQERVDFLAQNLCMSRVEVVGQLLDSRHKHIMTMDYGKLVRVMTMLLESSVSPVDIRKDLWVFRHNEPFMRSRLLAAIAGGAKPIKPWLLRCTEYAFQTFMERMQLTRKIAGGDEADDRIRYFAQRLGKHDVRSLVDRYPLVKRICVVKMKSSFDMLYECGVTADEVATFPNVLMANIDRVQSRLKHVQSCGLVGRFPLHAVCFPREKYDKALQRMITMNSGVIKT